MLPNGASLRSSAQFIHPIAPAEAARSPRRPRVTVTNASLAHALRLMPLVPNKHTPIIRVTPHTPPNRSRESCALPRASIPYAHIYDTPFMPIPPPCRVSLGYPAAGNSKFDPSVNPATESCDTESCNSVAGFSVTGFPRGRFSKILKTDGRRRPKNPGGFFFKKTGGGKITQIYTGFVVVDRGDENGRPHF